MFENVWQCSHSAENEEQSSIFSVGKCLLQLKFCQSFIRAQTFFFFCSWNENLIILNQSKQGLILGRCWYHKGMGMLMEVYGNSPRPDRFLWNAYNFLEKFWINTFLRFWKILQNSNLTFQQAVCRLHSPFWHSVFLRTIICCRLQQRNIIFPQRNSSTISLKINRKCACALKGLPQTHFDQWKDNRWPRWG